MSEELKPKLCDDEGCDHAGKPHVCYFTTATITTDNTKAAAELSVKLREPNALIATLVEVLEKCRKHGWGLDKIIDKALAEAKKWRGE